MVTAMTDPRLVEFATLLQVAGIDVSDEEAQAFIDAQLGPENAGGIRRAYLLARDGERLVGWVDLDRGLLLLDSLVAAIVDRFDRLTQHGPEPDGWMATSDGGGHYLYLYERMLPTLD